MAACAPAPPASAPAPAQDAAAAAPAPAGGEVERGKYLVTIMACSDCHTPFKMGEKGPEPDMTRFLSGHPESPELPPPPALAPDAPWNSAASATNTAFAGPWGISYAANLTPDGLTGMGIWTEENFVDAMKTGKHFGVSRAILPPMPWPSLSQATEGDLKAIYAFLRTIPPIHNQVPPPVDPQGGAAPPPGTP
jgi:hypothetical protein